VKERKKACLLLLLKDSEPILFFFFFVELLPGFCFCFYLGVSEKKHIFLLQVLRIKYALSIVQ
jgi:hypothetical protein